MSFTTINHFSLLGDTVMAEPAISAFCRRNRCCVGLYVNPEFRWFFEGFPYVILANQPYVDPSFTLSPSPAFTWAVAHEKPFAAGYFHQLGLEFTDSDYPWYISPQLPSFAQFHSHGIPDVLIAPFARSCHSHKGGPRNLTADEAFWPAVIAGITQRFPEAKIASLGSKDDPEMRGTWSLRGRPWPQVTQWMSMAPLLITVETGILHLVRATETPETIWLSCATPEFLSKPHFGVLSRRMLAGFATEHCYQKGHVLRSDGPHWNPQDVIAIAHEVLGRIYS